MRTILRYGSVIKIIVLALPMVCVRISTGLAQSDQFIIAANSSSKTYEKMLGEIVNYCSDETFSIKMAGNGGGAVGNLDALVNNKANAAFLHSDVFFANSQADPSYNQFPTLLSLWPEQIHVLVLRHSTFKKGTLSWNYTEFNTLADLSGFTIGAAGGGVITARILTGQGQGGFNVVPFDSGDQVIASLNEGNIAAAIFVGAEPLPNLEKLDPAKYKLIPIGEAIASHVAGVYRPAKITYPGLTNGPLATMAPICTMLTRKYRTPSKIAAQKHFRECFYKHLPDLQDNGSRNWTSVDPNDHGVLNNWYDLPGEEAVKPTSTSSQVE